MAYKNAENMKAAFKAANVREPLAKAVEYLDEVMANKDSFLKFWKSYEPIGNLEELNEEFFVEVDKLSFLESQAEEELAQGEVEDMRYAVYIVDLSKAWLTMAETLSDMKDMLEGCLMTFMNATRGQSKEMSVEEFEQNARENEQWIALVDKLYKDGVSMLDVLHDGVKNIPELLESSEIAWDEVELG